MEVFTLESIKTISWDEVSDIFEELLEGIGWSNDIKILWAEKAWIGIENKGLADFSNELERYKVYMRLFSIVVIYGEFCSIITEETFSPDFNDWVERMELSPLRIGQMIGSSFEPEEIDEYSLLETAISDLVNQTNREVLKSVSKEFGGINLLFVGLWLTNEDFEDDFNNEDDKYEENNMNLLKYEEIISNNADYVLNYDTSFTKMEAYSWLTE